MRTVIAKTALAICLALPMPTVAETFGYGGFSLGIQQGSNPDNGPDEAHGFGQVDGAIGFRPAGLVSVIFEAQNRSGAYSNSLISGSPSTGETNLAGHLWIDAGGLGKVGAFGGYAFATNPDPNARQTVAYFGVEALRDIGRDLVVFGQIGAGTSGPLGTKFNYGFHNGMFGRAGITWGGMPNTSLRAEIEVAGSPHYENFGEAGAFSGLLIAGETVFGGSAGGWAATYSLRTAIYDVENDPDRLVETTIMAGFRYSFGGKKEHGRFRAGMIGTPLLPVRATTVSPMMDDLFNP